MTMSAPCAMLAATKASSTVPMLRLDDSSMTR
jgi:hypothetical protein